MVLQLSAALASNPRTWPIFQGKAKGEGIEFVPTPLHPSEIFWRQLRFADFDVSEMSMSSLMMTIAGGDKRWLGIPVFTTRQMFHTAILVRKERGIETPSDLKGKKVGVPEYQQTAALWTRGVLQHEFGVAPKDIEWWMERNPDHSHAGATGFKAPKDVTINLIANETNIGEMMINGSLDAVVFYIRGAAGNLVDRSRADLEKHPDIKPIFADRRAEGVRFYQKTGLYPINHGMVIKRAVAEKHPEVAAEVLRAFQRANDIAEAERREHVEYHVGFGLLGAGAREALETPLIRHGVAANRKVLEACAQYSFEQGLTPRLMKLDELFAPGVMNT
jgi:4,5-dihydroxyphthalate decarboxylase